MVSRPIDILDYEFDTLAGLVSVRLRGVKLISVSPIDEDQHAAMTVEFDKQQVTVSEAREMPPEGFIQMASLKLFGRIV